LTYQPTDSLFRLGGTPSHAPDKAAKSSYKSRMAFGSRRTRVRETQTMRSDSPRNTSVPAGMSRMAITPTPWMLDSPMRA